MQRFISTLALVAVLGMSAPHASAAPIVTTTYDINADMLAMELSSVTGVNPNGVWTYGGYDDLTTPLFTAFGPAQHLNQWGTFMAPPVTGGKFQGYGFDTPAII